MNRTEKNIRILWTDDEIDLLTPHIIFLKEKGYEVEVATNGIDTIEMVRSGSFDLIFLDEHMPGLSGIETLSKIRQINSAIPVVMVTKSEDEKTMEMAIGSKMTDYLIKPVKPNQVLLSIKKSLESRELISRETTSAYQIEFRELGEEINSAKTYPDWEKIYKKLVFWELELERLKDPSMYEIFRMQKTDAGQGFSRFIRTNYPGWFGGDDADRPLITPVVVREKIIPLISGGKKVFLILIDNLRLDQWRTLYPVISEYFTTADDGLYCSILPTATQYARNSLFAGLMPGEIARLHPGLWVGDEDEKGKNLHEEELLKHQLKRLGIDLRLNYEKVSRARSGKKLTDDFSNLMRYDLSVIVYNFIDVLTHANTDQEMIRELAGSDSAYRSLVLSWFRHSRLLDLIRLMAEKDVILVITTDHGSVRVNNPVKVIGDKKTSANLRYKTGRNLNYNPKEVFEVRDPHAAHLPKPDISYGYIFAMAADFFAYPNNYNYYVNYYRNTYQHGGISMEEMIVPLSVLKPK
ncbi:MAG: PglZ domain-containing protein [Bacteroidales bacterium]|nr:PglZ domain-containing protein [Bacteroidales bacterium]